MRADSIHYLTQAGFDFKPAESPDLWPHIESQFTGARRIGPKFVDMPASDVAHLIATCEEALLNGMVRQLRRTGHLDPVIAVLDMPFVLGIDADITRRHAEGDALRLIDQPGTAAERMIHVLPSEKGAIPSTCQATVRGGVYPNGHTVGLYALCPGNHADDAGLPSTERLFLATPDEIASLARDMESHVEDIVLATRQECDAMIARAKNLLKA